MVVGATVGAAILGSLGYAYYHTQVKGKRDRKRASSCDYGRETLYEADLLHASIRAKK